MESGKFEVEIDGLLKRRASETSEKCLVWYIGKLWCFWIRQPSCFSCKEMRFWDFL